MYAVGVGDVKEETLLTIGGDPANVFDIAEFTELDSKLDHRSVSAFDSGLCPFRPRFLTSLECFFFVRLISRTPISNRNIFLSFFCLQTKV